MHVAIDCRLMFYRRAGIAQYTRRLLRALAALNLPGARLTALLDRRDADIGWLPPSVAVWRAITPAHHRYESIALPAELAARRIDVLHSPDFITARGRFRKVITVHDLYFLDHRLVMDDAGARYYGRVGWSVRQADRIVAVSRYTRSEILRLLPGADERKITVVHEAPLLEAPLLEAPLLEAPPAPLQSPPPAYALFVGTFEPRKNLDTLLRAVQFLPGDFALVVVGEAGWAGGAPAAVARELGVASRVHFAGRASDGELDAWYRGARMLVFPSLAEGFGLPVVDAMARGVPVVCSNAGALPEVAGDAALMCDPLDAPALGRLMARLWAGADLRAEYARRGAERARSFTWERAARETWRVYQAAAGARAVPGAGTSP